MASEHLVSREVNKNMHRLRGMVTMDVLDSIDRDDPPLRIRDVKNGACDVILFPQAVKEPQQKPVCLLSLIYWR